MIEFKGQSKSPVFIGGLMKSGTTLLRALLGQHPRLFGTFETHWYEDAIRIKWYDPTSKRMTLLLSLLDINNSEYGMLYRIKSEDHDREFIDIVMEYCCNRAGKQRWIDKTPDNIKYWNLIQKEWSDAYLIHVTREYKDIYASWKSKRRDSLDCFISVVTSAYDDIKPLLGKDADHYIEVDYTELVFNTVSTLRRVVAYLGEEWSEQCAKLNTDNTLRERNIFKNMFERDSWTFASLSKPIFKSSVGQWKTLITDEERKRIEHDLKEFYAIYDHIWQQNSAL